MTDTGSTTVTEIIEEVTASANGTEPHEEPEPVTLPEPDDTERMSRQGNPRQGVVEILQRRLERVLQPVDDDDVWHGVNVITRRDLLEAMVLPLPPTSTQAAAVTTPAFIYVDAVCPVCGIATEISLEVGVKLVAEGYSRKLQLVPKAKDLPHQCGQLRIRDVTPSRPVKGQTAIDFGGDADSDDGEATDDVEPAGDLEDQLEDALTADPGEIEATDRDAVHALAAVKPVEGKTDDLSDLDDLPL